MFTTPFYSSRRLAVSWTQRFLTRNILPNLFIIYDKKKGKQMFAEILGFKEIEQRMIQDFIWRTTKQTFLVINLGSYQKITKRFFSSHGTSKHFNESKFKMTKT